MDYHIELIKIRKQRKGKVNNKFNLYFNSRHPKNELTERNNQHPNTCLICASEDHWIAYCQKAEKLENGVHWNAEKSKLMRIDKQK